MTKTIEVVGYKDYLKDLMNSETKLCETVGELLGYPKALYREGALSPEEVRKYESIVVFNEAGNVALVYEIDYHVHEKNGEFFSMRRVKK